MYSDATQPTEARSPLKCEDREMMLAGRTTERRESSITVHKEHRLNAALQKRIVAADNFCKKAGASVDPPADVRRAYQSLFAYLPLSVKYIECLLADLRVPDTALSAAMQLTELLSSQPEGNTEHLSDVQRVIELDGLPVLVFFLRYPGRPELVREALMLLRHISHSKASVTHEPALLRADIVPQLFAVIAAGLDQSLIDLALGVLADLALASASFRDLFLQKASVVLVTAALQSTSLSGTRHGIQLLATLCGGRPKPVWLTQHALPSLVRALYHSNTATITAACDGLAALINDAAANEIQAIGEAGPISRLVELLGGDPRVTAPALFVLCNICTVREWVQACVSRSLLRKLNLIGYAPDSRSFLPMVLQTLQRVTSASSLAIQSVIEADLVTLLLKSWADLELCATAIPVVTNVFRVGTAQQAMHMLAHPADVLSSLWDLLTSSSDPTLAQAARQALSTLASRRDWGELRDWPEAAQGVLERVRALPSMLETQPLAQP